MDRDTALAFVEESAITYQGKSLTYLQREVFCAAWDNTSYEKCAEALNYQADTLRTTGSELWQLLSQIWGCQITKKSLKGSVEHQWRLQGEQLPSAKKQSILPVSEPTPQNPTIPHIVPAESQVISQTNADRQFIGREEAIAKLDRLIDQGAKCILILGSGGVGKTTLARRFLSERFEMVLEFPIAKEPKDIAPVESLLEEKLRELGEEPGRELMVSLDRLKNCLFKRSIAVLIDNIEPALDPSGRLIEAHRGYVQLLRTLTDERLQGITLITSREPLAEGLDITPYTLPALNLEAWQEYFSYRNLDMNTPAFAKLHKAYGGNALAMKVLCEPILSRFQGDIAAYWQDKQTEDGIDVDDAVANLIREQFESLKGDDLDAHNLLCRMGCFRYQDVPTVPKEGLIVLLWDAEFKRHRKIIDILENRCLVDFENNEYCLHPVIREEAIKRLRNSDDWEKANIQSAKFWTESVEIIETVKDALTAFEAYYHYLNIKNFDQAGYVIANERLNSSRDYEALGRSLYIFGQLSIILKTINQIIDSIDFNHLYLRSNILNILGDIYWSIGDISQSINIHEESKESAEKAINQIIIKNNTDNFKITRPLIVFRKNAIYNIGLCYVDIFEYQKAWDLYTNFYSELKQNPDNDDDYYYLKHRISCSFILAFLDSCLSINNNALKIANKTHIDLNSMGERWIKGYGLFFLGLTYKNLSIISKAFELYDEAITFAEEHERSYPQVKGKALTGLAELYRIQNEFKKALAHHQESIEILDKIGAKCDLAEAYFQLALTYQSMDALANSQEYFNKAIYLWSPEQIDAPKQIERVNKAMNQ